jgi:hypothetical protein
MWYWKLGGKKTFIFRHIIHKPWYICPIALPVRRNRQHISHLTVFSIISAPPFQPLRYQRNVCHPDVNRFTWQTLPTVNRKHFFIHILYTEYFCRQKKKENAQKLLLFCSKLFEQGHHFYYWNQPMNLHIRVCYQEYYDTRLCCYLVIHIENLFHPLQMFYFHLWPIYWLNASFQRLLDFGRSTYLRIMTSQEVHQTPSPERPNDLGESLIWSHCNITREPLGTEASDVPIVLVPDNEGGDTRIQTFDTMTNGRGKSNYSEKCTSKCHFIRHINHAQNSVTKSGFPQEENWHELCHI